MPQLCFVGNLTLISTSGIAELNYLGLLDPERSYEAGSDDGDRECTEYDPLATIDGNSLPFERKVF